MITNNTILVVDDEIGIRELLSEILRDEGYRVALAENAEQARIWRSQTRPDLVLLDIWMPDTDGITLLKDWASNGMLTMPVIWAWHDRHSGRSDAYWCIWLFGETNTAAKVAEYCQ